MEMPLMLICIINPVSFFVAIHRPKLNQRHPNHSSSLSHASDATSYHLITFIFIIFIFYR